MKVYEVQEILDAEMLTGQDRLDHTVAGAGGADIMAAFLAAATKDAVILTGSTGDEVIRTAKVAEVAAVVFVRGKKPDESAIALARSYNLLDNEKKSITCAFWGTRNGQCVWGQRKTFCSFRVFYSDPKLSI